MSDKSGSKKRRYNELPSQEELRKRAEAEVDKELRDIAKSRGLSPGQLNWMEDKMVRERFGLKRLATDTPASIYERAVKKTLKKMKTAPVRAVGEGKPAVQVRRGENQMEQDAQKKAQQMFKDNPPPANAKLPAKERRRKAAAAAAAEKKRKEAAAEKKREEAAAAAAAATEETAEKAKARGRVGVKSRKSAKELQQDRKKGLKKISEQKRADAVSKGRKRDMYVPPSRGQADAQPAGKRAAESNESASEQSVSRQPSVGKASKSKKKQMTRAERITDLRRRIRAAAKKGEQALVAGLKKDLEKQYRLQKKAAAKVKDAEKSTAKRDGDNINQAQKDVSKANAAVAAVSAQSDLEAARIVAEEQRKQEETARRIAAEELRNQIATQAPQQVEEKEEDMQIVPYVDGNETDDTQMADAEEQDLDDIIKKQEQEAYEKQAAQRATEQEKFRRAQAMRAGQSEGMSPQSITPDSLPRQFGKSTLDRTLGINQAAAGGGGAMPTSSTHSTSAEFSYTKQDRKLFGQTKQRKGWKKYFHPTFSFVKFASYLKKNHPKMLSGGGNVRSLVRAHPDVLTMQRSFSKADLTEAKVLVAAKYLKKMVLHKAGPQKKLGLVLSVSDLGINVDMLRSVLSGQDPTSAPPVGQGDGGEDLHALGSATYSAATGVAKPGSASVGDKSASFVSTAQIPGNVGPLRVGRVKQKHGFNLQHAYTDYDKPNLMASKISFRTANTAAGKLANDEIRQSFGGVQGVPQERGAGLRLKTGSMGSSSRGFTY